MKKTIFMLLFVVLGLQQALSQNFIFDGLNYTVTSANTASVAENPGISEAITIPAEVTNNGTSLSVTSIGEYAFYGCSGLTSVTIGNSVTSIDYSAFLGCSGLTSVTIPNSVKSIGEDAFYYCSGLTSVTIPNSVKSIGQNAFYGCSGLTSVTIPNSVNSIDESAFAFCTGLTSVTIPNSVKSIGQNAFVLCSSLKSITIPNSVDSIGESAFSSCSGLTSVTIGNSVTSIGNQAFQNCSGLTTVTIPNSVTSIGMFAFYNCSGLTSVVCEMTTPLSINSNVFQGVNQGACSLTVPNASVAAYAAALVWKNFAPINCATPTDNTTTVTACNSYTWANNSQTYTASGTYTGTTTNCVTEKLVLTILSTATDQTNFSSGGLNYIVTSATTVAVDNNSGASGIISIPTSVSNACFDYTVTSIGDDAFRGCSGLTSVTIPNSLTSIGSHAFDFCSGLTAVTIPNSVTSIGQFSFSDCSGLTSVTIPNSVTSIGSHAFGYCSGLTSVVCEMVTPLSINSTVFQAVNQGACSLTVPAGSIAAFEATPVWKNFTPIRAQTKIYSENFEGTNSWTLNVSTGTNGADNNFFVISENEGGVIPPGCSKTNNGNKTLHITSVFFPTGGALYDAGGLCGILFCPETNRRAESPIFSTVGLTNISVNFDFIGGGDGLIDNASIWYNAGSGWSLLTPSLKSPVCGGGQGQWTNTSITLPVEAENKANVRIGFNWTNNDDGIGTDPSFAVDNIIVSFTPTENTTSVMACNSYFWANNSQSYTASGTYTGTTTNFVTEKLDLTITTTTAPGVTTNQTFCGSKTVADLVAVGTDLKWYDVATNGTALTPTSEITSGNYYVSQTLNSCESDRTLVEVTVTQPANPNAVNIDVTYSGNCASLNGTYINSGLLNGYYDFQLIYFMGVFHISYDGTKWVLWENHDISNTGFMSSSNASNGLYPPTTGWIPTGCEAGDLTWSYATPPLACYQTATFNTTSCAWDVTGTPPAKPTASAQSFCGSKTVADLVANGTDIKWYAAETGGTALTNETALVSGTTYYASQTLNGCESDRTTVVVTVRTLPTPSISGNPIICTGGTKTLDAGTGYASYLWTPNGETTQTITVGAEAAFSVTVTDNFGCSGTSDAIQTAFSTASVGLSNLGTSCLGGAQLALSGDVSTLASVQWYNNTTPIGGVTNIPLPTVVAGGNGYGEAANQLKYPDGIVVDGAGNLYVVDKSNERVQKWVPGATQGITVAGGNGEGPAANQLDQPTGIVLDAAGNLYVADADNNRIQKWVPGALEGITVAGGNGEGSAANQFDDPKQIVFDATGNLYVADYWNNRIQKWAPGATQGITVAGGHGKGSAANQLDHPAGVAIDAAGNLYVADSWNNRIQKWVLGATEGITVAGNGEWGSAANQFDFPSGIVFDTTGNLYVADEYNSRIQKLTPGATEGVVVAGGSQLALGATPLIEPTSVFVTNSGAIYVSDYHGEAHNVQKWESYHQAFTPTTAGSYTAVVTNVHGCTTTTNAVVVNQPVAPSASAQSFCGGKTVADLVADGADIKWHAAEKGGNALINETALVTGTTYYASQTLDGCESARSGVAVTVNTTAAPTTGDYSYQNFCVSGTVADLEAFGTSIQWYAAETGGTALNDETVLVTGTSYYASQTLNNCESTRAGTIVILNSMPSAPLAPVQQSFCSSGTVGDLQINPESDMVMWFSRRWYAAETGGDALSYDASLVTGNYYVSQTRNGCESSRTGVTVTLKNSVAGTVSNNQLIFIGSQPVAITLSGSQGAVQWQSSFNNSTFADIAGATDTTLTSIQMGTLTTKRYFRAVVTNGSCTSATSSVVTVTVVASTKVQASQCGTTLAALNTAIYANAVLGASEYRFKVSKTEEAPQFFQTVSRWLYLTSLTNIPTYNTTYTISVATLHNGVWSDYGDSCYVITPAPPSVTKLRTTQCGTTLALINSPISADLIFKANRYRFEIRKDNAVVQELISSTNFTRLTNLSLGAKYGTTYSVRVGYSLNNGITWSDYGPPCSLTTPAPPTTKLRTTQCETTLASINNAILADLVINANRYQFEISKDNASVQELTSSTCYTRLTYLTEKVQYGTTYDIRIKYSLDKGITWSEYGPSCSLTTPSQALTTKLIQTPFQALTTKLITSQCGTTLALLNSRISADEVVNANKYRFEISKDNAFVEELTSTTYSTRFTNLSLGAKYGTTYSVRVAYSFDNGATWSAYGLACTVTTPSARGLVLTNQNSPEVSVYPNPFSSTFKVGTSFEGEVNIIVIDNIGKLIEQFDIEAGELESKEFGREYIPGMYHVTVTQDTNAKNFKIVKNE